MMSRISPSQKLGIDSVSVAPTRTAWSDGRFCRTAASSASGIVSSSDSTAA